MTSKHYGHFIVLIIFIHLEQKINLNLTKKVCKNKDFCGTVKPSEKDEILEFKQYMKSNKMPYIIYADFKFLIRKIDGLENNPENCSTKEIGEHVPCGYSIWTICGFDQIWNKKMELK